jgi:hypothetical protein
MDKLSIHPTGSPNLLVKWPRNAVEWLERENLHVHRTPMQMASKGVRAARQRAPSLLSGEGMWG